MIYLNSPAEARTLFSQRVPSGMWLRKSVAIPVESLYAPNSKEGHKALCFMTMRSQGFRFPIPFRAQIADYLLVWPAVGGWLKILDYLLPKPLGFSCLDLHLDRSVGRSHLLVN
jgi:hypothetical protein